ncbi:hypothetical protein MLD38_029792 [Melastoma candidum]|uniref:Uncharacterized protein n=1 Tax=Melastoma candidum TaxID=119954 RepID=A0ACB9N4R7_9MYRT|nr:hypothetical protein MLD38_029792 [Melastoma candidum]
MSSSKLLSRKTTTASLSWTKLFFRNRINTASTITLHGASPIPTHRRISGLHLTPRSSFSTSFTPGASSRVVQELLAEFEKEKQRERDSRKRAGIGTEDIVAEDDEDFMGIAPLIEKLEKEKLKDPLPTLSSERSLPTLTPMWTTRGLIGNFIESETLDDAFRWMNRIDKFEEKHLRLRPEYRVIGKLMNCLKFSRREGKHEQGGPPDERSENFEEDKDTEIAARVDDGSEEEFDDMKERDDVLIAKLNEIDRTLEEKLAELDHTFGRKDVNRTCKVTKGGQVARYTAMLACGNYQGVVGFAKTSRSYSCVKHTYMAYEKCFQNLHYIERHEEHTIAHAVQMKFKQTKVYLWPASTRTGMKAGRTVETILNLAGFKNVKSKVIGSRNPHNTVKAFFKALNAIETPKDVQEKFGRTVTEKYLL